MKNVYSLEKSKDLSLSPITTILVQTTIIYIVIIPIVS